MKKIYLTLLLLSLTLLSACSNLNGNTTPPKVQEELEEGDMRVQEDTARIPEKLEQIPDSYMTAAAQQGSLEALEYNTYEAFSYDEKTQELKKTAYVYLPYGYDESKNYNVFYLMHGGWSNETTLLGTPGEPHEFKHILDHAIQDGKIEPLIVVCPTYNNTSGEDSGNYSLALELTDLYHQELVNDLIPAVESKYSSYAEDTTSEGIIASRDHRGFGGFSMGSVTTWRTFEHCLDQFRYFMPMSGNVGDGTIQDKAVDASDWDWDDFFIFTASGTEDFAYRSFKSQVMNMAEMPSGNFRMADNEKEGNLSFREQEGAAHDGYASNQYMYNGLRFFWRKPTEADTAGEDKDGATEDFTLQSTVDEVTHHPAFEDFGRLLFPVDRTVSEDMTLEEISSDNVYVWYSNIHPEKTVEIVNGLKDNAEAGQQIFYPIYSEEEIAEDASKQDTGLFYFRGTPGEKFAVLNAGGGFAYVGAMHDSFPHALELSKKGYNAFALIYRPDDAYEDLAAAIAYITDHAKELEVDPSEYSLWGGSAGARMAATLGNEDYLAQLTGRTDIRQAAAVIMQYTGYADASKSDAPTYVCVGKNDGIANWRTMQSRLEVLEGFGIPTEFHAYDGLRHGFGIGTGTIAEGWLEEAVAFWEEQM